ncbi:acid phosphatase det1 [Entophlyctis luteolus]|nr:acid phosphatase det1 [Entophlyctis luteolus]KAJ3382571.1 acid phosphatase det1 [Entophlyctis sp. JEL0112]
MHAHPGSTSVFALVRRRQERPTSYREMRKVYQTIVPDAVARNCELPTGARVSHILGFTLSGSLLLCLSDSHHSVLAFAYGRTDNSRPIAGPIPDASFLSFFHKNPVFKTTVTVGTEQLTTDFCVFTPNRRFVILASARVANNLDRIDRAIEDVGVRYPHGLNSLRYLDNITFWLICLSTGAILDKLKFPVDHILLSSAAGVQIHNDILAITSIKNQTIHFFHVQESGRFVKVREIGWHNYDDDEVPILLARAREEAHTRESMNALSSTLSSQPSFSETSMEFDDSGNQILEGEFGGLLSGWSIFGDDAVREIRSRIASSGGGGPLRALAERRSLRRVTRSTVLPRVTLGTADRHDIFLHARWMDSSVDSRHFPSLTLSSQPKPFSGIKQRLLTFLYKQAVEFGTPSAIRHYFMTFEQYSSLVIWRMQFLDHQTILIKFGGMEASVGRNTELSQSQTVFFVVYSLLTTQVTAVFDNASQELLELFASCPEFRGMSGSGGGLAAGGINFVTTACNNIHAREYMKRQLYSVRKAKNGGVPHAVKRVLAGLPVNPQLYIESPYLDQVLFNYDESIISNINRYGMAG